MKNNVLNDIKDYAIKQLKGNYTYCGVAEGPDIAILNSSDKQGNDIKITIKVESK